MQLLIHMLARWGSIRADRPAGITFARLRRNIKGNVAPTQPTLSEQPTNGNMTFHGKRILRKPQRLW